LGLMIIIIIGSLIFFFNWIVSFLFPGGDTPDRSANLETLKFAIYLIGGLLFIWQIYLTNRRTRVNEKTAETIFQGQIQERFKNAIDQLGSDKESVNLGAIYTLHHISKDSLQLRKSVFDILCSYIRETTSSIEYQNKKDTSIKIQSVLNLLFVDEVEKLIYIDYIADIHKAKLYNATLSRAYLFGADLTSANLSGADMSRAGIVHANLTYANLTGANLTDAILNTTDLSMADLSHANLTGANLTGANLTGASLDGMIINQNWTEEMKEWNCKGIEYFNSFYKVIEKENLYKKKYWVVVKKDDTEPIKENE
jgi:hypothetical protein